MKKLLIILGMLVISLFGFGQVSKQQAVNSVLNSVVGDKIDSVNVYMDSVSRSDSFYKLSRYDSIQSPYANYWLFFIDDMPEYGWGHDCRYVFVNSVNGAISIRNSQTPPWYYKNKLVTISEPIGFDNYPIDTIIHIDTGSYSAPVEGKYAVLFSGGEASGQDMTCFWNALSHSYCGLIENGFEEENIFVLSFNGDTIDGEGHRTNRYMDLNRDGINDIMEKSCSVRNLQSIFDSLAIIMDEGDLLYIFGTMHGYRDTNNSDVYWLGLWDDERLYDTVFASMVSQINCSQYFVNLWACASGGIVENIIAIPNDIHKVVLSCTSTFPVIRRDSVNDYIHMDRYNYFINTALRYYHPDSRHNRPWDRDTIIGTLNDPYLYSVLKLEDTIDINFDEPINQGNGNGIQEINELMNYTKHFDTTFSMNGVKHYDCGFKDDLLSLHGITGKVVTIDTVSGNFHIEDTLSVCASTLTMNEFAKFYLFDADLIIEGTASLVMKDSTAIIARSGNCRVIVKGTMTLGQGVTFEARDGATLEIIFENNADLAISNASFINCDLVLPQKNISFTNCHFIGTPLAAEIHSIVSGNHAITLANCNFIPNGRVISDAIYIKHYSYYLVQGCSVDASGEGSYDYGISIYNSGSDIGAKCVRDNLVTGCQNAGILVYASYGDIRTNTIEGNGYGVKLFNNSNIERLTGNCRATTASGTQYIHDNEKYEVFMTSNCIPETFRYNYIADDDNIPFVYYDASIGFVDPGTPSRSNIDVSLNYWGTNFSHSTHLYSNSLTTGYDYLPFWSMGQCTNVSKTSAELLLAEADSLNNVGEYASARSVYMQLADDYPNTVSAETALKTLLVLEELAGNNYDSLKSYYLTNDAIASDENLSHLASSLANKCDERLGNYEEAIGWYEDVLTNPNTSFNDSIFAAIDLGDLYLKMEYGGEKAIGKLGQYKPESAIEHDRQTSHALSLLPRNTNTVQSHTEYSPIQDLDLSVGITVSPNPTNSLVRIEGATVAEVQVYNAMGQLMKTAYNSNEINLKGLPCGVYTVFIGDKDGNYVIRKVVVE